jgi:deoxyribodipyrimidine photo-lyase
LPPIVHWFRRDLRIGDNTALSAAARDGDGIVTVFVLDNHYSNDTHYGKDPNIGPARFRFLRESLEELGGRIAASGGRLLVRQGPAADALPRLLAETGASAVYANAEVGPWPESRDSGAAARLEAAGARLRLFPDALLVEPDALLSGRGEPYALHAPFAKAWSLVEKKPPVAAPGPGRFAAPPVASIPLSRVRSWKDLAPIPGAPRGGEAEAERLLEAFTARLSAYAGERDFPALDATSRLSPHLHFGTISPRTILREVRAGEGLRPAANKFVSELAWREFFHHVLFHFPRVAGESFRRDMDDMEWNDDAESLATWREGRTGYPIVDAGMRQLSSTHWMHNRARMIVASFLTKDLHIHWRAGERWFEHELVDADLANNNGGWQWAAGTGPDAAPFFRIFNPSLQSKKFDPEGAYIRRYVPELARVPAGKIHEPWTMTEGEQREAGCRIGTGRDYPAPIVDHAREREVALERFARLRR